MNKIMLSDVSLRRNTRSGGRCRYPTRIIFGAIAELAGHASYRLDVLQWWAGRLENFAVRRHGPYTGR